MKHHIFPRSPRGIIACLLSTGFIGLLFARCGLEIKIPKLIIGTAGGLGLLAAIISYIKNERGAGIIYSISIGLAGIFWAIVELYFPY